MRQSIEVFHLVFLRALVAKGEDKGLIALKGGSNLRFFFNSPRYSEDIDLDVVVIAKETLENKIERLLHAPAVIMPLKAQGIEVVETSASKQTDTTQRWKVGLRVKDVALPLRSKIEFSRRAAIAETAFERIDPELLRPYGLSPFLATHYTTRGAIAQKIHALSARAQPQARDLFDLNLLLARSDAGELALSKTERSWLGSAVEHALSLSWDEYRSQVVAYLDPSQAELYDAPAAWDALRDAVVTQLEALQ